MSILILILLIEILFLIILSLLALIALAFYTLSRKHPFSFQILWNERGIEINIGDTNQFDPIFPLHCITDQQLLEEVEAFNEQVEEEYNQEEYTWEWDNDINWGAPAWEPDTPEDQVEEDNNSVEEEPEFNWGEPHIPDYRDADWVDWAIQTVPFAQLRELVYSVFRHDSINPSGFIYQETEERRTRRLPRVRISEAFPTINWEEEQPLIAVVQEIQEEAGD